MVSVFAILTVTALRIHGIAELRMMQIIVVIVYTVVMELATVLKLLAHVHQTVELLHTLPHFPRQEFLSVHHGV
jgi:hypothetical protein